MELTMAEFEEMTEWANQAFPNLMAEIASAEEAVAAASERRLGVIEARWIQYRGGIAGCADEGDFDRMMEWAVRALPDEAAEIDRIVDGLNEKVGHLIRGVTSAWFMHRAGAVAIVIEVPKSPL